MKLEISKFEQVRINKIKKIGRNNILVIDHSDPKSGIKMKELRENVGLNQKDLAGLIGKSQGWVTFLETGRIARLDIQTTINLALALDISVDDLLIYLGYMDKKFVGGSIQPQLATVLKEVKKDKQIALAKVLRKE